MQSVSGVFCTLNLKTLYRGWNKRGFPKVSLSRMSLQPFPSICLLLPMPGFKYPKGSFGPRVSLGRVFQLQGKYIDHKAEILNCNSALEMDLFFFFLQKKGQSLLLHLSQPHLTAMLSLPLTSCWCEKGSIFIQKSQGPPTGASCFEFWGSSLLCASEVEQFESDRAGSSLHASVHFKARTSTEPLFGFIVKVLHGIYTFPTIKMSHVQFGNLLSASVIELWMCKFSLLDCSSQKTSHLSRLSIQDPFLESAP